METHQILLQQISQKLGRSDNPIRSVLELRCHSPHLTKLYNHKLGVAELEDLLAKLNSGEKLAPPRKRQQRRNQPNRKIRLSDAEILELRKSKTLDQIATMAGVSRQRIYQVLQRAQAERAD